MICRRHKAVRSFCTSRADCAPVIKADTSELCYLGLPASMDLLLCLPRISDTMRECILETKNKLYILSQ